MKNNYIRLSPIVRLNMTFSAEMNLDKKDIFGRETFEKYLEMHQQSEVKQEQAIKFLFFCDMFLFLVMNGQSWSIPGLGIQIGSLPSIHEILLFTSAISFFLLCGIFITNQCYIGVIDQFGNRIVNQNLIDPDFFNASRKHFDFFLKIFRPKLNIWGADIYQHGRSFAVFAWVMKKVIYSVILILPATHLLLTLAALLQVWEAEWNLYGKVFLVASVAIINIGGLAMVIGMSKDFTFTVIEPEPQSEELEPISEKEAAPEVDQNEFSKP